MDKEEKNVENDENTEKVQDATNVENDQEIEVEKKDNPENTEKEEKAESEQNITTVMDNTVPSENANAETKKSKKSLILAISLICVFLVIAFIGAYIYNKNESEKSVPRYYNGTYSFYIEEKDKNNSALYVTGLVKLENGVVTSKKIGTLSKEEKGSISIIGSDKKISLVIGSNVYSGKLNGKDIDLSLQSGYNLAECYRNRDLKLKYEGEISIFNNSNLEEKAQENIQKGQEYLNKAEEEHLKERENPYNVTKEYDGVYSCYVEDKDDEGYGFYAGAYVVFEDGKTYMRSTKKQDRNSLGYFGIKDEKLVFELDIENKYEARKEEKNIKATLVSGKNITGREKNKELILTYEDSLENKDKYLSNESIKKYGDSIKEKGNAFVAKARQDKEAADKAEKERKAAEEKANYKNSCVVYKYDELARNPSAMKGKPVKVTGKVIQSMKSTYGNSVTLRVNITKTGSSYYTYYTDTVYVTYTYPDSSAERILEDDIITIYGDSTGETSYQSTLSGTVTIPSIDAKYIERN